MLDSHALFAYGPWLCRWADTKYEHADRLLVMTGHATSAVPVVMVSEAVLSAQPSRLYSARVGKLAEELSRRGRGCSPHLLRGFRA